MAVSAGSMAANPWADDYGDNQRYVVRYVLADGSVEGSTTTDRVRPGISCQDPVALPWEDESTGKSTVALRIRDRQTGTTRVYDCS
ncbi:hypothetical protein SAHL_11040 [Salinisphaera orenii YIM 95161]|uniref:Uncharacterized protein n=1 Tax=Salinisphaera orenii YIM 95161 TaxID=1051139 RepID=A0A423PQL6_9GAMM|nr:hypothetical protein SAHL_11040 [Salinisphaera halophila YIM 95161]